ncbi:MAG: outer membrane protein assembly factor BamE [Halioglobus sp.]
MPPPTTKWKFYPMRTLILALTLVFTSAFLTACGFVGFPGVYKIDVEQGNIITQEIVDQLKPGMSRRQVRFILGTPLVEDTFNEERWDYVYVKRNGLDVLSETRLQVEFEGDALKDVSGDFIPAAFGGPAAAKEEEGEQEEESAS